MKRIVIGVAGKIGSGKDHITGLLAGYIAREANSKLRQQVRVIRFADPIKTGLAGMFELPSDFLYHDANKCLESPVMKTVTKRQEGDNGTIARYDEILTKVPATYGELQQVFGTAFREFDKSIFARYVRSKVETAVETIIVPDLRYPNELTNLQLGARDCKLILIKLVGQYTKKSGDHRNPGHSSETEVDSLPDEEFDYILNTKTYKGEDMKHIVKQILIQQKVL